MALDMLTSQRNCLHGGGQAREHARAMSIRTGRAQRAAPAPVAPGVPSAGGLAAVALFAATGHLGLELVSNFLPVVYPILVAEAGGVMADNIGLARALATQVIPLLVGVLAVGGYALLSARGATR